MPDTKSEIEAQVVSENSNVYPHYIRISFRYTTLRRV